MGALPPRATPRPAVVGAWIGLAVLLLCLAGCRTAADLDGGARGAPEHSPQALALAPSAEATVARPGPERPQLPGHSLGELRLHAARHNPGLRAAFERWKADLERIPQARSLPDPRFTYGYFIERVETRVGPQRHRFSLQQMLPASRRLDCGWGPR
jgi:cobalt-zinc-cadmium efflux system outer membrane protein